MDRCFVKVDSANIRSPVSRTAKQLLNKTSIHYRRTQAQRQSRPLPWLPAGCYGCPSL